MVEAMDMALCEVCKTDSRVGMIAHSDKIICTECAHKAQDLMVEAFQTAQAEGRDWDGAPLEIAKAIKKIEREEIA